MSKTKTKTKTPSNPELIEETKSGEYMAVIGHVSKSDGSVKNRQFWAATDAVRKDINHAAERLNSHCATADKAHDFVKADGIPLDLATEALQVLKGRIKVRKSGGNTGTLETHVIARAANGGTLLRLAKNQKTGDWALQIVGEQRQAWTTTPGTVDWAKENARLLKNCIAGALKQCDKRKTDPDQSISKVVALLVKRLDQAHPLPQKYRTPNLLGKDAMTCESIAIHGQRFTDMLSVVAYFRPDLVDLLKSASA